MMTFFDEMYVLLRGDYVNYFGQCAICGDELHPVRFVEEEYRTTKDGYLYKTGRKRSSVSHLECLSCRSRYCVDDSFDGNWQ